MTGAALILTLAVAPVIAASFGNSSMGEKPYGVLILAYDTGGAWKTELGHIRSELRGVAVESVESAGDGTAIQRGLDRLKGQHVSKVVAIPLELISESAVMDEIRYLFGIRAEPTQDKPDEARPGMAPVQSKNKSALIFTGRGPKRLKSEAALVLTATIDKSPALADILSARATALARDPAKEAVILVGLAPRSDKGLDTWKAAVSAIAESVRVKGGFREGAIIWVRDGTRAGQQDKDRAENKATLRRLITAGGVVAVPLAPDGRRVGQLLQRQLGTSGYRWNGKGLIGDPRLTDWIISISKAASTLPDVRHYRDNAQGGFR
ncbi:MAG: hypothetical protein COV48_13845 [Elusimicrobia bacterium CG11_big_fil_rev_8_21_14_0_20_64_6]|nr:MAG: hypothetical protein COV48_13845 [Elusimicrobia bacterium CG11_big_fil_rev_8_21_14_0_20_64_6]